MFKLLLKTTLLSVAVSAATLTHTPLLAQEPTFKLNLKNADIHSLIETVSRRTGRNFVVDPRVKARVTVISSTPTNADELYETFLSILQVHGYSAVPAGTLIKIVPSAIAKLSAVPVTTTTQSAAKSDKPKPKKGPTLQLSGVFAAEPKDKAFAIISVEGKGQRAYGIGDKIWDETTLHSVYADHVVLSYRGKREKLVLPNGSQTNEERQAQIENAQTPSSSDIDELLVKLPTKPGELRDTIARNPSLLGRLITATPFAKNGELVGYRITPTQNHKMLESHGIISGDVITKVNDIELNSQKQGIRALRDAVKAEKLDVVLLRDGSEVPISISLVQ